MTSWTTKSPFSKADNLRAPCVAALALLLGLGSCAQYTSWGEPAKGFDDPRVAAAYIDLHGESDWGSSENGAAVAVAPGIAVTNAHNAGMVAKEYVIATVPGYDLLYFRTSRGRALPVAKAVDGEAVIAYGQDTGGKLRIAHGVVRKFWPAAFGYVGDGGPGFSGGPVLDAKSGALVGITYGYIDGHDSAGRMMVAYTMEFVNRNLPPIAAGK